MEMDEPPQFCFIYRSNGSSYRLRVPLALPYTGDSRELASRLVQSHALPCYLEERLADELAAFSNHATTERWDKSAEENLHGGSVFEKVSKQVVYNNRTVTTFTCLSDHAHMFIVTVIGSWNSLSCRGLTFPVYMYM